MNTTNANCFVQPYLIFNGRCEEAVEFYRVSVGAEVDLMLRYKQSPEPMPPDMLKPGFEDKIMHTSFRIGASTIMASDGCSDGETNFDSFSLSLTLGSEAEVDRVFAALAEGGEIKMPLGKTFWSQRFGMLKDRFGLGWMVTVAEAQPSSK